MTRLVCPHCQGVVDGPKDAEAVRYVACQSCCAKAEVEGRTTRVAVCASCGEKHYWLGLLIPGWRCWKCQPKTAEAS